MKKSVTPKKGFEPPTKKTKTVDETRQITRHSTASPQKPKKLDSPWTSDFFREFMTKMMLPFLGDNGKLSARMTCKSWHHIVQLPKARITPRRLQKFEKKSCMKALTLTQHLIIGPLDKKTLEFLFEALKSSTLRIKTLEIHTESINLQHMQEICSALEKNQTIINLNVSQCRIDRIVLKPLIEALESTERFESLDLSSNRISEGSVDITKFLVNNETLTSLNLSDTGLSHHDLAEIAGTLANSWNSKLRSLDISNNPNISILGLESIGSILENNESLTELKVSRYAFHKKDEKIEGNEAERIFSHLEENRTLISLDLSQNPLPEKCRMELAESLELNTTLQNLMLISCRGLDDDFLERLGESLETNRSLLHLGVSSPSFTDHGMKKFCSSLQKNGTLISLNLSFSSSVKNLGEILGEYLEKNTTLVSLNLSNSAIRNSAGCKLANAMKVNTTLRQLYLDNNFMDKEAAIEIAKMLQENKTLKLLCMLCNQIDISAVKHLTAAMRTNTLDSFRF